MTLIFIFSGKKNPLESLHFLLSALGSLSVSFCTSLGLHPLPPPGYPLIKTSAALPLNSLPLFFDFPLFSSILLKVRCSLLLWQFLNKRWLWNSASGSFLSTRGRQKTESSQQWRARAWSLQTSEEGAPG